MSTSEMLPDPRSFAPLVAGMLPEIDAGKRKSHQSPSAADGLEPSAGVAEELSARELEVLRYLPTMLTVSQIAAELYVSANTIKAHLRSIYRKLGTSRRQEAVVRAYGNGILRHRSYERSSDEIDPHLYDDRY